MSKTTKKRNEELKKIEEVTEKIAIKNEVETQKEENEVYGYVIDTSITGIKNLRDKLLEICNTKYKIILTSVTINELDRLQRFNSVDGMDARMILRLAAENDNSFEMVRIDETLDTPDECIIKYCADNRRKVILWTSDKTMALKARMNSVEVQYFNQPSIYETADKEYFRMKTLIPANWIDQKLMICKFQTEKMSIRVFSNGIAYDYGIVELRIGDDVFVATNKTNYVSFAHYSIISINAHNNCELIYSRRIYDLSNINVKNTEYKSFIKDFIHRLNL